MTHRSHRKGRKSIPKRSRTIPLIGNPDRGDGIDDGKYFKCWHCGFICDVDKDALGGAESEDGVVHRDYSPKSYGGVAVLGEGASTISTVHKNGPDGLPILVEHNFTYSDGSTGCPQCHTLNWRGDF